MLWTTLLCLSSSALSSGVVSAVTELLLDAFMLVDDIPLDDAEAFDGVDGTDDAEFDVEAAVFFLAIVSKCCVSQ